MGHGWRVRHARVNEDAERLSTPVSPGAVQAAGGLPLILGVAGGTMGGYPHAAHVITADLPRLAQLRPGDVIQFASVSLAEARRLDEAQRRDRTAAWPASPRSRPTVARIEPRSIASFHALMRRGIKEKRNRIKGNGLRSELRVSVRAHFWLRSFSFLTLCSS